MGFFAATSALLFLLIPPLVVLYFLKLKRPRLQVPSLVLWRQVLNDNRVNSPFQRFKRNILLWLQLLLLLLLILAAMQPYWRGGAGRDQNILVLIDNSASMAALDGPGGRSGLDRAKEQIRRLIDGLLPDQKVCLISFASTARKLTGFTNNNRILHEALDGIAVAHVSSDIEDALRLAQALSHRAPFERVLMFSDRNFPDEVGLALPFQLDMHKLDPAGPNVGITALSAKRSGGAAGIGDQVGRWDVFVGLEAAGKKRPIIANPDQGTDVRAVAAPQIATVVVRQDGRQIGTEVVNISADKPERIMFPVDADRRCEIAVRLEPEGFDSLAVDNVAYLDLDPARQLDVYVPSRMRPYRLALGALPGVRLHTPTENQLALAPGPTPGPALDSKMGPPAGPGFDLVISDSEQDLDSDAPVALYVGLVPEELRSLVTAGRDGTAVVDWHRNAPLLHYVQWDDVVVQDNPVSNSQVRETDYENLGYEVLVHGQRGPLLLRKRHGAQISYHMLFHTDRTTLVYRVGFPILLSNLVRIAMHQSGLIEARGHQTGVLPPVAGLEPNQSYRVKGPGGSARDAHADQHGILSGVPAPRVGVYTVSGPGEDQRIAASLLSSDETRLASVEKIQFKELAVEAAASPVQADHPLWRTLSLIALAVLVVEWWFFQKRPGGSR